MPRGRMACWISVIALVLASSARGAPRVVVLPAAGVGGGVPAAGLVRVEEGLVAALASSRTMSVRAYDWPGRSASLEAFASAHDVFDRAIAALESAPAANLDAALTAAIAAVPGAESQDEAAIALKRFVRTRALARDEARARTAAEAVLRFWPDTPIGPPLENEPERALLAAARDRALEGKRGSISVTSFPVGAWVRLDGRPIGQAPLTLAEVLPGSHGLVVEHESAGLTFASVNVVPDERASFDGDPGAFGGPDARALVRSLEVGRVDEALRAARGLAGSPPADFVLMAAVAPRPRGHALHVQLVRISDGAHHGFEPAILDEELLGVALQILPLEAAVQAQVHAFTPDEAPATPLENGRIVRAPATPPTYALTPRPIVEAPPDPPAEARHHVIDVPRLSPGEAIPEPTAPEASSHGGLFWGTTIGVVVVATGGVLFWALTKPLPPATTARYDVAWTP